MFWKIREVEIGLDQNSNHHFFSRDGSQDQDADIDASSSSSSSSASPSSSLSPPQNVLQNSLLSEAHLSQHSIDIGAKSANFEPDHPYHSAHSTPARASIASSSVESATKPMMKLAAVSLLCNLSFTLRAILLLASVSIEHWVGILCYFIFGEVLPISLMMFVFTK
jgi:hypothetical protein